MPTPHTVQLAELVLPVTLVKWPAGQEEHSTAPRSDSYVPRGQTAHVWAPNHGANFPSPQGSHDEAPRWLEYVPAVQFAQAVEMWAENAPASHDAHVVDPSERVNWPMVQFEQLVERSSAEKVPVGHSEQADAPQVAVKVPDVQLRQAAVTLTENIPGWQGEHAAAPSMAV